MSISEDTILSLAGDGLRLAAGYVGGIPGLVLSTLADVLPDVAQAVSAGGSSDAVVTTIRAALVAASNAEMKKELGP